MGRGHPPGRRPTPCRHCDDVDNYREHRALQIADWRNENAKGITFKEWLGIKGRFEGKCW